MWRAVSDCAPPAFSGTPAFVGMTTGPNTART